MTHYHLLLLMQSQLNVPLGDLSVGPRLKSSAQCTDSGRRNQRIMTEISHRRNVLKCLVPEERVELS